MKRKEQKELAYYYEGKKQTTTLEEEEATGIQPLKTTHDRKSILLEGTRSQKLTIQSVKPKSTHSGKEKEVRIYLQATQLCAHTENGLS